MNIRQQTEEIEKLILNEKAARAAESRGRVKPEKEGLIRTVYQRDRDRIIHSKSFRRLKHKTQVFLAPRGDHYRTRLTHTLEVSQIARTIARALRLNEDLTEAIALGHDLGHTPFGHAGEAVLNAIHPGGFNHYVQSLRVVDVLEKKGQGLNLTHEVRDGILHHSKGKGVMFPEDGHGRAETLEGQVVRVADGIAYANHDLDDALRAKVIKASDVPRELIQTLGGTHARRIDTMVKDTIFTSLDAGLDGIRMGDAVRQATEELRSYLYANVYENDMTHGEFVKATKILTELYGHFMERPEDVPGDAVPGGEGEPLERRVCDFVAGMTDRYAMMLYNNIFLPKPWGEM
ncbi:MAG: deoxyguanosinetriphosphate triphosphohydrolase [Nitrospirae bacterium]|nr:deoxyguanosinetriphosphate triphosphohydrolase [Nitrospirota bacterium]MBI5696671.1 deoxyguanosinetriphosphate triphosphohydrolase [Nitrospirota bacterium]